MTPVVMLLAGNKSYFWDNAMQFCVGHIALLVETCVLSRNDFNLFCILGWEMVPCLMGLGVVMWMFTGNGQTCRLQLLFI